MQMLICCFRLSCELVGWLTIAKSQALEIVYRAYVAAVEGVACEGESVSWGGARTKGEGREYELTKRMLLHSDLLKLCLKKKNFYDWKNRIVK